MKILLTCNSLTYMSGSPMYFYTLAMELSRNHEVTLYSEFHNGLVDQSRDIMFNNLTGAGVELVQMGQPLIKEYDVAFISQIIVPQFNSKAIINIVHSEYDCESPMEGATHYVAIRPSIKQHLIESHGIPEDKVTVIYNGVDRERFSPGKRIITKHDKPKVVLPCTIDPLREKFLNYYINKANNGEINLYIYGLECGANIQRNANNTWINPPVWNIEDAIADADYVGSILLGRVNLEARSMGIKSMIHNPENPSEESWFYPDDKTFDDRHNIKNVAKKLIKLI